MAVQLLRGCLKTAPSLLKHPSNKRLLSPQPVPIWIPRATILPYDTKRSGYKSKIKNRSNQDKVKEGFQIMKEEIKKYKSETKKTLLMDNFYPVFHGDYEVVWKFDEPTVKDWILTTDKDNDEGKSQAEFIHSPNNTGVFRGYLNTDLPKDGITKYTGYCNIKSPSNVKSFLRERPLDWTDYSHLLVRCRGDGRSYQIVIKMDRYFDLHWSDTYQYALYTRGGPYWQIAKIPFSKFFLACKGRIQDKQEPIDLDKVLSLGITVADSQKGAFQLEIDYIALIVDQSHKQKFAYEMYKTPAYSIY